MVAAGMGDDTGALRRGKQDGVARAAGLEGPGLLEELALEEHLTPTHLVQGAGRNHRGYLGVGGNPICGLPYSGE